MDLSQYSLLYRFADVFVFNHTWLGSSCLFPYQITVVLTGLLSANYKIERGFGISGKYLDALLLIGSILWFNCDYDFLIHVILK